MGDGSIIRYVINIYQDYKKYVYNRIFIFFRSAAKTLLNWLQKSIYKSRVFEEHYFSKNRKPQLGKSE